MNGEWETLDLQKLDGRPSVTQAAIVNSVTDAMRALRVHPAVTQAGYDGSITVWMNARNGTIQGVFQQFKETKGSITVGTFKEIREWLKEWFPRIGDRHKLAMPL